MGGELGLGGSGSGFGAESGIQRQAGWCSRALGPWELPMEVLDASQAKPELPLRIPKSQIPCNCDARHTRLLDCINCQPVHTSRTDPHQIRNIRSRPHGWCGPRNGAIYRLQCTATVVRQARRDPKAWRPCRCQTERAHSPRFVRGLFFGSLPGLVDVLNQSPESALSAHRSFRWPWVS